MNKTIKQRKFGVELELGIPGGYDGTKPYIDCWRDSRFKVEGILRDAGLNTYNTNPNLPRPGGTDHTKTWVVKGDSSLRFDDALPFEVNTRILQGTKGLNELKRGMAALKAHGAYVNSSCGLHVHVDVSDLTQLEQAAVGMRYNRLQERINGAMDEDRVGPEAYNLDYTTFRNEQERYEGERWFFDNYKNHRQDAWASAGAHKFTGSHVVRIGTRYDTVEFRQHHGCLDEKRVAAWVKWCIAFVETSARLATENKETILRDEKFIFKRDNPLNGLRCEETRAILEGMKPANANNKRRKSQRNPNAA